MVNQLIQCSPWLPFSEVKYVFKPVKEVKVLSSLTSHKAGQAEGGFPIFTANDMQVSEEPLFFSDPWDMHKGLPTIFSYFLQNARYRAISIMGQGMYTYITFHYPPLFLAQIPKPAPRKNASIYVYMIHIIIHNTLSMIISREQACTNNTVLTCSYSLYIIISQFQGGRNIYFCKYIEKPSVHITTNK